jgi:hypothetical protein
MGLADSLGQQTDEGKKQALQALADAGTRGLTGYAQAQTQTQDYQSKAIQDALAGAQARGANAGTQDMVRSTIAQPGNDAMQRLAESQGIFNQDLARRQAAVGAFFDQSKTNAGLVQASTDQQIALQQQKYEQAQAARSARASAGSKAAYTASEMKSLAAGLADLQAQQEREAQAAAANSQAAAQQVSYEHDQQGLKSAQEREQPVQQVIDSESAREQRRSGGQGAAPVPVTQPVVSSAGVAAATNAASAVAGHATSDHVAEMQKQAVSLQGQYDQALADQQQAQQTLDAWQLDEKTAATRDAYAQMTGDPVLAAGLFKRQDPESKLAEVLKQQQQTMTQAEQDRQAAYFAQTGFKSPQDMAAWANADQNLTTTPADREIARQLGADPSTVQQARQSDEYQSAVEQVRQALQTGTGLVDANGNEDPVDENFVRSLLSFQGIPPELQLVVIADMKPYLYSSGYTPGTPATDG